MAALSDFARGACSLAGGIVNQQMSDQVGRLEAARVGRIAGLDLDGRPLATSGECNVIVSRSAIVSERSMIVAERRASNI